MTTLVEKLTQDGAKLSLIEYTLEQPETLGRLPDSKEMYLELTRGGITVGSTSPSASAYLKEEHYRGLLKVIESEVDFHDIADVLNGIQGPSDVNRIEEIILEKIIDTKNPIIAKFLVKVYLRKGDTVPQIKDAFITALHAFKSNVTAVAEYCRIQRTYLHRIIRKLGISPTDYRS